MSRYFLYHLHSDYSLLDSCTDYKEYCDAVKADGGTAISFSEHGLPRGWVSKKLYCDQIGLKFVHSVEIYLTRDLSQKVRDNYHTVLIAKNMDGVRELNRLMNISTQPDHFYFNNRISFEEFCSLSPNIITTSACLAGPLSKLSPEDEWFQRLLERYDYLEVQPHLMKEQEEYNQKLAELSAEYHIPLIAGTDTHSLNKYKDECRDILLEAKNKRYPEEEGMSLIYIPTDEELINRFHMQGVLTDEEILTAMNSTHILEDSCEPVELDRSIKYPVLNATPEQDEEEFEERTWESLDDKLNSGIIPREQEQAFRDGLKEELRVFKKIGMGGFMLSMSDLVRWCKDNDIAVGTSRGSVGGSMAAYVTDITDLNPVQWGTIFSRFANEDRVEVGDVDIDLVPDDRDKIFNFIKCKFGAQKTARVSSFGTVSDKGTIDEIARALSKQQKLKEKYSLSNTERIKKQYEKNPSKTREKYPELFYYMDGIMGTKVSQSVHPAGMVISPVTLDDNYGTFLKDGETCLLLDMDEAHEVGLVKYDFLALKTVQVLRDTCRYAGVPYPKTNEIDFNDKDVWEDACRHQTSIFQFESSFSNDCFRKLQPKSIQELTMLTACMRPSGASYRDALLARVEHHNPSPVFDEILKETYGYLIYQESVTEVLMKACGLNGSTADTVRRGIAKKDKDLLDKMMPVMLDGYCSQSPQPREIAEKEAKEFLQVIQDSASYMFGKNHAVGYSLMSYFCAYYRYHYPVEYTTAFLNNAKNDDDIVTGIKLASIYKITMVNPKWGVSGSNYFFDRDKRTIYRGVASIKFVGEKVANELYELANSRTYASFMMVLKDICQKTSADTRVVSSLIRIGYFDEFGNQRELSRMFDLFYNTFRRGERKSFDREEFSTLFGTFSDEKVGISSIIEKYSNGFRKDGTPAKKLAVTDMDSILLETEQYILSLHLPDLDDKTKMQNYADVMGSGGYVSYREEDRRKLSVLDVKPLLRKRDQKQFGYSVFTRSIGSGKESRFTVFNSVFNKEPLKKGDVFNCDAYKRDGQYFTLTEYTKLF